VTPDENRQFWMHVREALLMMVDAVERYMLKLTKRTSELRKERRGNRE
jgi:hypothetical protein